MKKVLFLFALIMSFETKAQFEGFDGRMDVHAGYAMPLGNNYPINGGIAIGAEPKFWYNESLVFGGKLGFNFLGSPAEGVKLAPLTTIVLLGEKYFGEGDALFFAGASAGVYAGGQTKKIYGAPTQLKAPKIFGYAPRGGIQFGPYRLMAELHVRKNQSRFVSIMLGYTFGE
ncbi:MAG: hypothetical protein V4683_14445 [Bacteroidota bacterium]